jgi:hypothetical protein
MSDETRQRATAWRWGEDGAGIWADTERGERRIASLPLTAFADPVSGLPSEVARIERKKTARLIAAAPRLLAACRRALNLYALGEQCGAAQALEQPHHKALAKADEIEREILAAIRAATEAA